jgi:hypothetical protein
VPRREILTELNSDYIRSQLGEVARLQQAAKVCSDLQEAGALDRRAQNLLLIIEKEARQNAWDHLKEVLSFGSAMLFLSFYAGVASAIIPMVELCATLDLFEIHIGLVWSFTGMAFVFTLGFFCVLWFAEDGPPRPGRGILKGDTPKLIGAWVFNFFFISGLVLVVVSILV